MNATASHPNTGQQFGAFLPQNGQTSPEPFNTYPLQLKLASSRSSARLRRTRCSASAMRVRRLITCCSFIPPIPVTRNSVCSSAFHMASRGRFLRRARSPAARVSRTIRIFWLTGRRFMEHAGPWGRTSETTTTTQPLAIRTIIRFRLTFATPERAIPSLSTTPLPNHRSGIEHLRYGQSGIRSLIPEHTRALSFRYQT